MVEFIFMLTQNDFTISNAIEVYRETKGAGFKCVGFKDIGLPNEKLMELVKMMKNQKMKTFLEVVSGSEEENLRSAKAALDLRVDYLIGGTFPKQTLPLVKGSGVKYFPYIGKIIGHPCLLRGTISEIVEDAKKVEKMGAHGINLLAYRYDGDVRKLIMAVKKAVNIPLIIAGSIDSYERVREMVKLNVWAFTIGGAILERRFIPRGSLSDQLKAVLEETNK
ncbi:MAG: 4-hydroxythreonine-4-phosphate dehydrogenase [Candidatus Atabeyarchaeum deiterrae]